ncbi:MAG: PIN domain-containing protein [Terracidiphilus sp.]|jgi:predicted nucleic acid-binding protein|nr:PIN domain-containing protein [Terracidiphilus sp.]
MTVFVLDSSAFLRYVDDEAGADRVGEIFIACVQGQGEMRISALQWGEIAGKLRKRLGPASATRILESLIPQELEIIPATGERAVRASALRLERKISYVDGFALDLAMESGAHVLVTADYDFKPVAELARIEFLPAK